MSHDKPRDKPRDLSAFSLFDLFRVDADSQCQILTDGLLALDRNTHNPKALESLMRAAHSIKGAAAVVGLDPVVQLAHEMESCFVAVQDELMQLTPDSVDALLAGVDLILQIARTEAEAANGWLLQHQAKIDEVLAAIAGIPESATREKTKQPVTAQEIKVSAEAEIFSEGTAKENSRLPQAMKVSVENFDRLVSLASESLVAANTLHPMLLSMRRFKRMQESLLASLDDLHQSCGSAASSERIKEKSFDVRQKGGQLKPLLLQHIAELESCERRLLAVSRSMLDEVLALRMRPFGNGVQAFPRMVRDLARSLGKEVRLEISGQDTKIDSEILSRLESPVNHLLRNAIDHGMESPEERQAAGKPREGVIRMEARHRAGVLNIHISDDGRGVDLEKIRGAIVRRNMASEAMAAAMSTAELLDFLMLPGFSLKETISELSGRGVGLDVVDDIVRQHYGKVRLESEYGRGFITHITLPVSQSVVRALIFDVSGEPYALPISLVERVIKIDRTSIHLLEDKPFFTLNGEHVGLVSADQLLELPGELTNDAELPVVVIASGVRRYGLMVDSVIGEKNLVVQPTEPIFGKLRDISAAAFLDDGAPVLILDVVDLLQSIEKLLGEGKLRQLSGANQTRGHRAKHVLVVDDSLTVREMERQLLLARGFAVDVAVDGMDGWNAVRSNKYDLVITDIDMPRMDGIELVTLIKQDLRLHELPVMVVSYKDRPEDRARGISAGADYYLTKGSFHDQTLLEAVVDLIGESNS
jgi:two-component system, chemotaxis family, sensor histidine kinase and response regulator WspE